MDGAPETGRESDVPTSVIFEDLLSASPDEHVSLDWVVAQLGDRSFGVVLLLIALMGLVPGISSIAALLLAFPAIQMIMARPRPVLPRFVARRRLQTVRLERLVRYMVPVLRWLERLVRPRWRTPFEATKRGVGLVILLLCVTLLVPIPFSNVVPTLVTMLLAFAFLEEDGILLCAALVGAALSIAVTVATIWGAIEAGLLL